MWRGSGVVDQPAEPRHPCRRCKRCGYKRDRGGGSEGDAEVPPLAPNDEPHQPDSRRDLRQQPEGPEGWEAPPEDRYDGKRIEDVDVHERVAHGTDGEGRDAGERPDE